MSTALIVIDVQEGLLADPNDPIWQTEEFLENVTGLIARARQEGAPVVYVQHEEPDGPLAAGEPGFAIHEAVRPQPGDPVVVKRTPSAFHQTNLAEVLAGLGAKRLVLCGLQTDFCVDTTARHGSLLGYEMVVAQGAHSTFDLPFVTAEQIIRHHEMVWRSWFAKVQPIDSVSFC